MNKNKKVFMWYKVNELWKNGLNKSQISKELLIDRGTVRKYLQMDEDSFMAWINSPRRLPKKLSPYYQYVKQLLESTPYLSSAQVEDRLKETYKELPYVDSKTVYNFVQSIRKLHDIPKYKEKTHRQYQKLPEPDFGVEAQVDFGEYKMQTSTGNRVKVYFFAMVLSRSRYKFVYCQCMPFTSRTASYAHELAFAYFKGIPRQIIYDQDSVFMHNENLGDILLTEEFNSFCKQYPFEKIFCKKADPESKGKIENVVKYVKYNFLKGRLFLNLETLQRACIAWLERTGNIKLHSTTKKVPKEQWEIEQGYLLPYSNTPVKPFLQLPEYKVRKDNTIAYRGNFYSVPVGTYSGVDSRLQLEDTGDNLVLYSEQKELVATHKIPSEKGIYVRNTDHARVKSKRLQQTHELLLNALGNTPNAKEYLHRLQKDKPRYYHDNIAVMMKAVQDASGEIMNSTLSFCIENNVFNGYQFSEVLQHYQKEEDSTTIKSKVIINHVNKSQKLQSLQPTTSNINFYETII